MRKLLIASLLLLSPRTGVAATLTLVAGGDGSLKTPFAVEFDQKGATYVVELDGHRVLKLGAGGKHTVICGDGTKGDAGDGGPAAKARVNGPHNLAVGPESDIYLADTWNSRVRKIDATTGVITTVAGGPGQAKLGNVYCVAFDTKGKTLYLADLDNRRILALDVATGALTRVAGNGQKGVPKDGAKAVDAPLVDPRAVAADAAGNVYVLERNGHALRRVNAKDGTITTVVNVEGKKGLSGDGGDAKAATMNGPKHICVDRDDSVLIADAENHVVRRYLPKTGTIVRVAGTGKPGAAGLGGPPEQAQLNRPHGVTVAADGALYIADSYNHRILKIAP